MRIKELTYKIDHDDLIYYLKGDIAKKNYDDFDHGIELFKKVWWNEARRCKSTAKYI